MSENENLPTWQDISAEQFDEYAHSSVGQSIADEQHRRIYGDGTTHSSVNSCPCYHVAVDNILRVMAATPGSLREGT